MGSAFALTTDAKRTTSFPGPNSLKTKNDYNIQQAKRPTRSSPALQHPIPQTQDQRTPYLIHQPAALPKKIKHQAACPGDNDPLYHAILPAWPPTPIYQK